MQIGKSIYCAFCPGETVEGTTAFQIRQITPDTALAFRTIHTCDEHAKFLKVPREYAESL